MGAMTVLLMVVALVPAPREFRTVEGVYGVSEQMPCPWYDWVDFDLKGTCLKKARCAEFRDASLPPEGYRLKVAVDGVVISAADDAGAFYARKTLEQLATVVSSDRVEIACCEILDWPQYRWRGLMLDEARHFFGKGVVKRTLDLMAMHKLKTAEGLTPVVLVIY